MPFALLRNMMGDITQIAPSDWANFINPQFIAPELDDGFVELEWDPVTERMIKRPEEIHKEMDRREQERYGGSELSDPGFTIFPSPEL